MNDEERREFIIKIADYIIETKASTRVTATQFKVSNFTVSEYMNNRLKQIDKLKYLKVQEILNQNKPKTIEDEDVKNRINIEVGLLKQGFTATEIARNLGISIDVIHDDLTTRLSKLDLNTAMEISALLKSNSLKNLPLGTSSIKDRDEKGRFASSRRN